MKKRFGLEHFSKIVAGERFDSKQSIWLARRIYSPHPLDEHELVDYEDNLFCTEKGTYFIYGNFTGCLKITKLNETEAMSWCEKYLTADEYEGIWSNGTSEKVNIDALAKLEAVE